MKKSILLWFISFIALNLQIIATNLDSGMVAYYPFNGNTKDESGNGNDGSVLTHLAFENGVKGKCAKFSEINEVNSLVIVKNSELIKFTNYEMTISFWARLDDVDFRSGHPAAMPIAKSGHSSGGFCAGFWVNKEDSSCTMGIQNDIWSKNGLGPNCVAYLCSYKYGIKEWVYLTYVIYKDKTKLYKNGELILEDTTDTNLSTSRNSDLYIGGFKEKMRTNLSWYPYIGCIDELRFYNRAVGQSEVKLLYLQDVDTYIISPNSGEKYLVGDKTEIKWDCKNLLDTFLIEYSFDKGNTWNKITDTANGGIYIWQSIPNTISDLCLLKITKIKRIDIDKNIWAYYPLDSNANDYSGNLRHGKLQGASYKHETGIVDSCLRFYNEPDNSYYKNDYVILPNFSGEEFTVSLWINKIQFNSSTMDGISVYSFGSDRIQGGNHFPEDFFTDIFFNNNLSSALIKELNGSSAGGFNFKNDEWHHIVNIVSKDKLRFYVDGKLFNESNVEFQHKYVDQPHYLAYHQWEFGSMGSSRFNGSLDDVRIYERAINSDEVEYIFNKREITAKSDCYWSIFASQSKISSSTAPIKQLICSNEVTDSLKIWNTGGDTLRISDIKVVGADASDFNILYNPAPAKIAKKDTALVIYSFIPKTTGTKIANLEITSNSSDTSKLLVPLNYSYYNSDFSVPNAIKLDDIYIKNQKDTSFTITNTGSSKNKYVLSSSEPTFEIIPSDVSLNSKASINITLRYNGKFPNDTIITLVITVIDTICNKSKTIPVSVYLWEYKTLTLEVGKIEANSGELINLPIYLRNGNFEKNTSITAINAELVYNSTLLYPNELIAQSVLNAGKRIITLNMPISAMNDDVLANISMTAALGNAEETPIEIQNIKLIGGNLPIDSINGHFKLLDVCDEGGKRLLIPTGKIQINSIKPNPAYEQITVELDLIEKSGYKLSILNSIGRTVREISRTNTAKGITTENIEISELSSGSYTLILQTQSEIITEIFMILK